MMTVIWTDMTRAYWLFLNCVKEEVTRVDVVEEDGLTIEHKILMIVELVMQQPHRYDATAIIPNQNFVVCRCVGVLEDAC
jgi:hypothetical protein